MEYLSDKVSLLLKCVEHFDYMDFYYPWKMSIETPLVSSGCNFDLEIHVWWEDYTNDDEFIEETCYKDFKINNKNYEQVFKDIEKFMSENWFT